MTELKFGIAKSANPKKHQTALENFLTGVQIIPIFHSIDFYATEKARLQRLGTPIDDFDFLIGATAVTHGLVMVTNNVKHFKRMADIVIEDWTK